MGYYCTYCSNKYPAYQIPCCDQEHYICDSCLDSRGCLPSLLSTTIIEEVRHSRKLSQETMDLILKFAQDSEGDWKCKHCGVEWDEDMVIDA